jgi:hypothetical protein
MAESTSSVAPFDAAVALKRMRSNLKTAGQDAQAEDEQDIADDRTGDRRFDDVVEATLQRHERDDQLGGVAERRIEKTAEARTGAFGQDLGGAAHQAGERHDGECRAQKDPGGIAVHELERPAIGTKASKRSSPLQRIPADPQRHAAVF